MTGITVRRIAAANVTAVLLLAALLIAPGAAHAAPAAAMPPQATSVNKELGTPGPLKVGTNYASGPCSHSLMGQIMALQANLEGNHEVVNCSDAFPYGFGFPVGVQIFAPVGEDAKGPYPPVIFMPGIGGNPAQYTALARNWASHGFIVAMPFTFWNSLVEVPTLGTAVLAHLNAQPGDPLYRKVDFSRVTYAGHSAGGQGALQAASVYQSAGRAITPKFRVIGVFTIQNGPLAIGATVHVPALILGGRKDFVVPPWAWQKTYQYNGLQTAPAYFAVAKSAHHLDVARSATTNPFIGVTTAWLLHTAYNDPEASAWFVGQHWLLPQDKNFDEVCRNSVAASTTTTSQSATAPAGGR